MHILKNEHTVLGMAWEMAKGYSLGFIYGAAYRLNRVTTARTFAVSLAAYHLLDLVASLATAKSGTKGFTKEYYAAKAMGGPIIAGVQIISMRQLNIISTLGTSCIAFGALCYSIHNIDQYRRK